MQLGKILPFSKHNTLQANGEQAQRCSPLAFSSFFNDDFFLNYFNNTAQFSTGVTTNQENLALKEYSKGNNGILNLPDVLIEQYTVFETNGKFTLPFFLLDEIFSELPDNGRTFAYFINTYTKETAYHKQILLKTKEASYLIDSQNTNVIVFEHEEYLASNYLKKLTNLSVLMSVHERKYIFGTEGYDTNIFKHLI